MATYSVHRSGGACPYSIGGDTLIEAIEAGFSRIASDAGIGNVAGYSLDDVWMEYDNGLLGGQGGVALHIVSHGSDCLKNYDPTTDHPREHIVCISAKKEDCPSEYHFVLTEVNDQPSFNPFTDQAMASPDAILGASLALMKEVADNCCIISGDFSYNVPVELLRTNPKQYLRLVRKRLDHLRPKQTKATAELMARVEELGQAFDAIPDVRLTGQYSLYNIQAAHYLCNREKVTALAYYRIRRGLTQQQLGEAVGITTRQIQRYEHPLHSTLGDAKYSVVEKISNVLGVKTTDLIQDGIAIRLPDQGLSDIAAEYPDSAPTTQRML